MFQKAFLILSASAIIGAGVVAPTATLAQFPGPPPLPGPVGPPPGSVVLHLNSVWAVLLAPWPGWYCSSPARRSFCPRSCGRPLSFHGVDRAIQGSGRHFQGRTASYAGGGMSGYGYDRGGWARRWGRYGAQVYGSSGYSDGSDSYAHADGCYYVYSQYAGRRVLVCSRD